MEVKNMSKNTEKETIETEKSIDNIKCDNRIGALVLLVSYCGLGIFMLYKTAELLVKHI